MIFPDRSAGDTTAWTFTRRMAATAARMTLRRFIDQAHANGIGVILDVVYNHVGPAGNYFRIYADDYFSKKYECEWGEPFNSRREELRTSPGILPDQCLLLGREYHMDGFRIDATQAIFDDSEEYILAADRPAGAAGRRGQAVIHRGRE